MSRSRLSSPGAAPSCLATIEVTLYSEVLENALEIGGTKSGHSVPASFCREAVTATGFRTALCAAGSDVRESLVARLVQPV